MPDILYDPGRGHRVPVYLWARDASKETIAQLERLASRPYVVHQVAAMADAHVSEGVAVGTVFATRDTVVPRALGGDLGCGVSALRLSIPASALERTGLDPMIGALLRAIPTGDAVHRGRGVGVADELLDSALSTQALERTRDALARKHLGTLGGGNHFLELDRDADDGLWLLVHSGSRGLGAAVAAHHVRAAEAADPDPLAGLDVRSPAGQAYLADQGWALAFAAANRARLAERAVMVLADALALDVGVSDRIDVHHNFIAEERWEGDALLVHRKGAVAVPEGSRAIVPGSMATASYLVTGLGCGPAFGSCSHGAGRVLTRRQARERVKPAALARSMRRIAWPEHLAAKLVEEAPDVYRDIGAVLEAQRDLVTRGTRLTPLAVVKG